MGSVRLTKTKPRVHTGIFTMLVSANTPLPVKPRPYLRPGHGASRSCDLVLALTHSKRCRHGTECMRASVVPPPPPARPPFARSPARFCSNLFPPPPPAGGGRGGGGGLVSPTLAPSSAEEEGTCSVNPVFWRHYHPRVIEPKAPGGFTRYPGMLHHPHLVGPPGPPTPSLLMHHPALLRDRGMMHKPW